MKNHIVQAVVPVNERNGLLALGYVIGEPVNQRLHIGDEFCLGGAILLCPASNLSGVVVAGLAIVRKTNALHADGMQRCKYSIHLVINRGSLGIVNLRHGRVPKNPTLQMFHNVEHRPDDFVVGAQCDSLRHRHVSVSQGIEDPVFPVYGMCGCE